MLNWVANNRLVLLTLAIILFFVGFVALRGGDADLQTQTDFMTSSSPEYKQIDQSSKMLKGSNSAKVSLIQYSDFLCPSCSIVSTEVMTKIEELYVDTGQVQFEFRPMAFIAPGSTLAGAGAYCAIDQGKIWEYHDGIYAYSKNKFFNEGLDPTRDTILTNDVVESIAQKSGLELASFSSCLNSEKYVDKIVESTKNANANGIDGTPYVMVNGVGVPGNPTFATIDAMIKRELNK